MKFLCLLFALVGVGAAFRPSEEKPWTVLITGDAGGNLSPCGCTKPMSGGIRRLGTAIGMVPDRDHTLLVDAGNWIQGISRQDVLKAQTMAQTLREVEATAAAVTPAEARLGIGELQQLARLSGNRMLAGSLVESSENLLPTFEQKGPFIVGTASARYAEIGKALQQTALSPEKSVQRLLEQNTENLAPALIFDGDHEAAVALAQQFPKLRVIVYRSESNAPLELEHVGDVVLVTPGEHAKAMVRFSWDGGKASGYSAIDLGPEYKDDPKVAALYKTYLKRVQTERLVEKLPRRSGDAFAGTAECIRCHQEAGKVWKHTAHAHALKTLKDDGQEFDPDCLKCHSVGLEVKGGYLSQLQTPQLADVGCESCHGGGAQHSKAPREFKLPKFDLKSCTSCHTPLTSPTFNPLTYWERIKHR